MKRLILSLFVVLLGATSAMGQISFYGEWYDGNTLDSKMWVTPDFTRAENFQNGNKMVMLVDMKLKKAYLFFEETKTCMVMEDLNQLSTNKLLGFEYETARSGSKELKGKVEVEGKECEHWFIKSESTYKDGNKEAYSYNNYIWPRLKASNYSGSIAHDQTGRKLVMKNIQIGAQPAHLFKIPEGYKTVDFPMGGVMEMLMNKPAKHNSKEAEDVKEIVNKTGAEIKSINNSNMSDEDKMKALIEMMGGGKKK